MKYILIIGVCIAVFLAILFFLEQSPKRRKKQEPYVIGQQLKNAMEKEKERKAIGDLGPSPLPQGRYLSPKGERRLLNPLQNQLDNDLMDISRHFASFLAGDRDGFRRRISLEEFYTLMSFAERSAVFSIRKMDPAILRSGLTAIAMVDAERTDYRDILVAVSILYHAAGRLGLDPAKELAATAEMSERKVRDLLLGFARRPKEEQDITKAWGFKEVTAPSGPGFVGWRFKEYHPTIDLLSVSLDIADTVDKDKYTTEAPELASELPDVWFGSKRAADVRSAIANVTGAVTISALLEEQYSAQASDQQFTVFLVEVAQAGSARNLQEIARSVQTKEFSSLAVAVNKLFCLVVARSFAVGVESFERGDSLGRFQADIEAALRRGQRGHPSDAGSPRP